MKSQNMFKISDSHLDFRIFPIDEQAISIVEILDTEVKKCLRANQDYWKDKVQGEQQIRTKSLSNAKEDKYIENTYSTKSPWANLICLWQNASFK